MIKSIKRFLQRGFRGYDETINWDYEIYFEQFIPEIEKFCNKQLDNLFDEEYNVERMAKYKQMLILIQNWRDQDDGMSDFYLPNNSSSKLWAYFGKNIGWFNS